MMYWYFKIRGQVHSQREQAPLETGAMVTAGYTLDDCTVTTSKGLEELDCPNASVDIFK